MRELRLMCKRYEHDQLLRWQRTRNIEFAQYNVQYNQMNGKKVFKNIRSPKDLYALPSDRISTTPVKINKDRQKSAIEQMKSTTNYKQWRMKN